MTLPPPPPADPPGTEPPIRMDPDSAMQSPPGPPVVSFRGIVKQSMTKQTRLDVSTSMVDMCQLSGWRDTTLNPDMSADAKMSIVAARFGQLAAADDSHEQYRKLMALSAATLGWAQGIARRAARDRKRLSRERKRARKQERKRARRERKAAGDEVKDSDG